MTLNTELPSDFVQPPFSSAGSAVKANQFLRDSLSADIDAFILAGGKITTMDATNRIVEPEPVVDIPIKRGARPRPLQELTPVTLIPYKVRGATKSKWGQNIRTNKFEDVFWVQIGALELGRGQNLTHKQAIELRDSHRRSTGMPPAEY